MYKLFFKHEFIGIDYLLSKAFYCHPVLIASPCNTLVQVFVRMVLVKALRLHHG